MYYAVEMRRVADKHATKVVNIDGRESREYYEMFTDGRNPRVVYGKQMCRVDRDHGRRCSVVHVLPLESPEPSPVVLDQSFRIHDHDRDETSTTRFRARALGQAESAPNDHFRLAAQSLGPKGSGIQDIKSIQDENVHLKKLLAEYDKTYKQCNIQKTFGIKPQAVVKVPSRPPDKTTTTTDGYRQVTCNVDERLILRNKDGQIIHESVGLVRPVEGTVYTLTNEVDLDKSSCEVRTDHLHAADVAPSQEKIDASKNISPKQPVNYPTDATVGVPRLLNTPKSVLMSQYDKDDD
jgi:hypothetical protein